MSTTTVTLLLLPTEILHRIFDDLDTTAILLSVQLTCKKLKLAVSTYNRFELKYISKEILGNICQVMKPENVSSLFISYKEYKCTIDDLMSFISNLWEFSGLRTLTFVVSDNVEFDLLFDYLSKSRIIEIKIHGNDQPKADFITDSQIKSCIAHRLTLSGFTSRQFSWILQHFPHLKSLKTYRMCEEDVTQSLETFYSPVIYQNLTDVDLDCPIINRDSLKMLLSCMPHLVRLNWLAYIDLRSQIIDGSFLAELISEKLPELESFTFRLCASHCNHNKFISIMNSFRTPFWYEGKKWFVSCTLHTSSLHHNIIVQSPPVTMTDFDDWLTEDLFSIFNIPLSAQHRITIKTVRSVTLNLQTLIQLINHTEINYANYYYFSNPIELCLSISDKWDANWFEHLIAFTELMYLETLEIRDRTIDIVETMANIKILLNRACNVHSLHIEADHLSVDNICSIVPHRIKQLTVWVHTYENMKILLNQFNHLSHITFISRDSNRSIVYAQMTQWLTKEGKIFTHKLREIEEVLEIYF